MEQEQSHQEEERGSEEYNQSSESHLQVELSLNGKSLAVLQEEIDSNFESKFPDQNERETVATQLASERYAERANILTDLISEQQKHKDLQPYNDAKNAISLNKAFRRLAQGEINGDSDKVKNINVPYESFAVYTKMKENGMSANEIVESSQSSLEHAEATVSTLESEAKEGSALRNLLDSKESLRGTEADMSELASKADVLSAQREESQRLSDKKGLADARRKIDKLGRKQIRGLNIADLSDEAKAALDEARKRHEDKKKD